MEDVMNIERTQQTRASVLARADEYEAAGRPAVARLMRKRAAGMPEEPQAPVAEQRRRDRRVSQAEINRRVELLVADPLRDDPFGPRSVA